MIPSVRDSLVTRKDNIKCEYRYQKSELNVPIYLKFLFHIDQSQTKIGNEREENRHLLRYTSR